MKIVVAAARLPFPLDKGDRLTVYHLLKFFSERHRMALVCFLEPEQDPSWVEKVAPFCERVETVPLRKARAYRNCLTGLLGRTPMQLNYYSDPALHQTMQRVVAEFEPDLLYAQLIRMGPYIQPFPDCARVVAMNLSMTLNHRRLAAHAANPLSKAFHSIEHRKLRSFELPFARQFEKVLLISEHDLKAVQGEGRLDNAFIVPHGVDYLYFTANEEAPREPNTLVMTGNMNYAPNVDAALHLCGEILPRVRAEIPDTRLLIVGADPTPEVEALGRDPGVTVTGRVPDLRGYMDRAEVGVAPIRIGAGLQNKVLEGMSMGLPMVVSAVANEGIGAEDGENVLIAAEPDVFARHVVRLLRDRTERSRLGANAREFIVSKWSWETHFDRLERMFDEIVERKKGTVRTAAV